VTSRGKYFAFNFSHRGVTHFKNLSSRYETIISAPISTAELAQA